LRVLLEVVELARLLLPDLLALLVRPLVRLGQRLGRVALVLAGARLGRLGLLRRRRLVLAPAAHQLVTGPDEQHGRKQRQRNALDHWGSPSRVFCARGGRARAGGMVRETARAWGEPGMGLARGGRLGLEALAHLDQELRDLERLEQ